MKKTIALLGLPLLAACATPKADLPLICMAELKPPGSYHYAGGQAVPTVSPGAGATEQGAADLNACIRSKAAASGITSTGPASSNESYAVSAGATPGSISRTYQYGTPPAATVPAPVPQASYAPAYADLADCQLEMVGGTGYRCARTGLLR